jgi:hypothetical protein
MIEEGINTLGNILTNPMDNTSQSKDPSYYQHAKILKLETYILNLDTNKGQRY